MSIFNAPKRRYFLLAPIIFLILSTVFSQYVTDAVQETLLRQKLLEVTNATNMVSSAVAYKGNICAYMEFLDKQPLMYAAAFQIDDGSLKRISGRNFETDFDPLLFRGFVEGVSARPRGNIIIGAAPEGHEYRDLHMYFRWVPISDGRECLLVAGVSKFSIVTKIPEWVSIGQWINTIITFLLNVWLISLLVNLGYIYGQREEQETGKWRCEYGHR